MTMTDPTPHVHITKYLVTCLPLDSIDSSTWSVDVEYAGFGRWAVRLRGHSCYDIDGNQSWEPIPSEREDAWLGRHRFDLDTALELARKVAPTIVVNGLTPAQVLERHV
jgi:hypothetical protein